MFLISIWDFIRMAFTIHIYTNILFMIIYVFSKKMETFFPALLFSESSPELPFRVSSWQSWLFLTCTSKLFQPLPINQSKAVSAFSGICYKSAPVLGPSSCLSLLGLLWQNATDWWLNSRYLFLTVLEAGKHKIKVLEDLVLGEGPLPGFQTAPSCCILT